MAFLEMYLNGEWKNLSSFGTVSSVDVQSSSSAITVTGGPITSVGIINLSFNPSGIRLDQFAVPTANLDINNKNLINVAVPTLSHHAANKSYIDSKTWISSSITDFSSAAITAAKTISLDQFAVPAANLNANNKNITNLATPTLSNHAADKYYVDNRRLSDFVSPNADISMNTNKIVNLATPTTSGDAVNKSYVDSRTVNDLTAPTSSFSMNSNRIINVANPTSLQDVATKNYVDTSIGTSGGTWQTYTPNILAVTTAPTKPNNHYIRGVYRITGKSCLVSITYTNNGSRTGVANGSGYYIFTLPSGVTLDTSKIYLVDGNVSSLGYYNAVKGTVLGYGIVTNGPFQIENNIQVYSSQTHKSFGVPNGLMLFRMNVDIWRTIDSGSFPLDCGDWLSYQFTAEFPIL